MNKGPERGNGLLASQGDPAESFDPVEEALDQMALLIKRPVDGSAPRPGRVLLDLRTRPEIFGPEIFGDELPQRIGVIAGIRNHMGHARQPGEQRLGLRPVAPLSGGDLKADRQAKGSDGSVNPGRQPSA